MTANCNSQSAKFPIGSSVRIKGSGTLRAFRLPDRLHFPPLEEQLAYGGQIDSVRHITFSVRGDVIYELETAPGVWQEQLLEKHITYSPLLSHVREALKGIEPTGDGELVYYPCRVVLKSGEACDTVYIVPEEPYMKQWGVYPENDSGKRWIKMEDITEVMESPIRLPARFANQIYDHGESGMGYTIFTVVFSDGERQACGTGNAVDFIRYPNGKGPNDVVAVLPHEGRNAQPVRAPDWYWCLYSGEPFRPTRAAWQVSGGLGSITETLTVENHVILYNMHWLIFKRRLNNLIRDGAARLVPPPAGFDGRGFEWYLDVATGDIYRYGPPAPSVFDEWMRTDPHKIDPEKLGRWKRVTLG